MKRKGWIAAAALVCAGLVVTAPARAQDRYVPDTSKKVSLDDLARYLGVKSNKKILEEAVRAAATVNIDNRQYVFEDAITAYDKKDYAGTVRALERARLAVELDTWRKEAAAAVEQLKKLNGGRDRANELERLVRDSSREGAAYWLRNRSDYLAKLQTAKDWIAAEPERQAAAQKAAADRAAAQQKAAEERAAAIAAANAKGVTAADFEYDAASNGKGVVITRYKGLATVVNIPAVIEGLPVTEIGQYVLDWSKARYFFGDVGDTDVGAFFNTEITSVTIPDSVVSIDDGIFSTYTWGSEVSITGSGGIFSHCSKLTSVTLPRNLKTIPRAMFAECTSLETINLPAGLTRIEEGAFAGCTGLKTITLPDGVTAIGGGAFLGCTGLTAVVLPKNLKSLAGDNGYVSAGVFQDCTGLTAVTFQSNNLEIGAGSFSACKSLTTLNINANVRIMGDSHAITGDTGPFKDCPITTVNIGPNVTEISGVGNIPDSRLSIATKAALNRLR